MSHKSETPSPSLSRAVANLLRLASSDVKDAELLSAGRYPDNARLLIHLAVLRIMEAIVSTERGWPVPSKLIGVDHIPNENPLKLAFSRIAALTEQPKNLLVLPDGNLSKEFDNEEFRRDVTAVRKLLQNAAERFEVDLLGNGPAKQAVPARPPALSKPEPPKVKQILQAVPTPSRSSSQAHVNPPEQKTSGKRPPISVPYTRAKQPSNPSPPATRMRAPLSNQANRKSVTSAAFWGLIDRWQISDLAALQLIEYQGGLSKKGARPRFKLVGEEGKIVSLVFEIDQTLQSLSLDPRTW